MRDDPSTIPRSGQKPSGEFRLFLDETLGTVGSPNQTVVVLVL